MASDVTMSAHRVGGYVVHADERWVNGNSATGLALAVHLHGQGKVTPSHVVHAADVACEHCPRCASVGCSERGTVRITWRDHVTGERFPEVVCEPCADAYERRPALQVERVS